jgi:hypothetical protein
MGDIASTPITVHVDTIPFLRKGQEAEFVISLQNVHEAVTIRLSLLNGDDVEFRHVIAWDGVTTEDVTCTNMSDTGVRSDRIRIRANADAQIRLQVESIDGLFPTKMIEGEPKPEPATWRPPRLPPPRLTLLQNPSEEDGAEVEVAPPVASTSTHPPPILALPAQEDEDEMRGPQIASVQASLPMRPWTLDMLLPDPPHAPLPEALVQEYDDDEETDSLPVRTADDPPSSDDVPVPIPVTRALITDGSTPIPQMEMPPEAAPPEAAPPEAAPPEAAPPEAAPPEAAPPEAAEVATTDASTEVEVVRTGVPPINERFNKLYEGRTSRDMLVEKPPNRRWLIPLLLILLIGTGGAIVVALNTGDNNPPQPITETPTAPVAEVVPDAAEDTGEPVEAVTIEEEEVNVAPEPYTPRACTIARGGLLPGGPETDGCHVLGCREGYATVMELSDQGWVACDRFPAESADKTCIEVTNADGVSTTSMFDTTKKEWLKGHPCSI